MCKQDCCLLAYQIIAMNLQDFFQTQESVTKMVSLIDLQFQNVNTCGIEAQIKISIKVSIK